jgi:putative ABC transport system permease protein
MIGGPGTFFEIFAQGLFGFSDQEEDFGKRDDAKQMIGMMIAAALAFMLLPAINLVNLNVSRILERASEIGVRKAFGASSYALVGQFVVENLVLTVLGGIIGLMLAETVLVGINQIDLVANAAFHINARVALYALALSAVFGVLSGVLPAWKMSRLPIVASLKGDINV